MNSVYDGQSLQAYGLRLQTQARRPVPSVARAHSRGLGSRLRMLLPGRTA